MFFCLIFLTQGKLRGETWADWPKVLWPASDRAGTRTQDFGGDPVLPATSPHIPQPNILATLWPGRPSALRQGAVRGAWSQQCGMAVWAGWDMGTEGGGTALAGFGEGRECDSEPPLSALQLGRRLTSATIRSCT